jgi:hypothetical protein
MEKLVSERKDLETLRDDIKKREELIQKKELLLNERTELEAKKMRTSQVLNKVFKKTYFIIFSKTFIYLEFKIS